MTFNAHTILIVIALILAILALIKPTWPLAAIALILVCVDLLAFSAFGK